MPRSVRKQPSLPSGFLYLNVRTDIEGSTLNHTLSILILEDKIADYELMLREVERTGYGFVPEWASSKSAFLKALDTMTPDLLLADYSLPGFDGLTAMKLARQRFGEIPVIIVSGVIGEERAVETLKAGATDYVLKQRLDRLSYVVKRALVEAEQLAERRKIEDALRATERRFKSAVDSFPHTFVLYNKAGRVEFINKSGQSQIGLPEERIIGKTTEEIFPSEVYEVYLAYLQEAIATRRSQRGETTFHYKNRTAAILFNFVPLLNEGGEPSEILGIFIDITERKDYEERLKFQLARYQAIIANMAQGLVIADRDGVILEMNSAITSTFGISPDFVGHHLSDAQEFLTVYDPNGKELSFHEWPMTRIINGEILDAVMVRLRTGPQGREWHTLISGSPITVDNKITVILITIRDISEQIRTEEQLRIKAQQLQDANKELEAFSYSVSHDLRAPLRTMTGFVGFLLEDCAEPLSGECREFLRRIDAGAKRMNTIIDDMLSLSRVSRSEISVQEVNLSDIAKSVMRELREAEPDRSVRVVIQEDLKVRGDAKLIVMALTNLLNNACKYTSKTENARVEFGASDQHGRMIYFVKDNGAGFDMSQADKLFEPFIRLHSDREFSGIGIGLAIVARIIKRHGGKIWAESAPGKGATFYFTLSSD